MLSDTRTTVRPPTARSFTFPRHLAWKWSVTDCEHFVEEQDLGLEMGRDRKG